MMMRRRPAGRASSGPQYPQGSTRTREGPVRSGSGTNWRRGRAAFGDEMGLGKTAQVAAFLGAVADKQECRTCLALAPTTMLAHWPRIGDPGTASQ